MGSNPQVIFDRQRPESNIGDLGRVAQLVEHRGVFPPGRWEAMYGTHSVDPPDVVGSSPTPSILSVWQCKAATLVSLRRSTQLETVLLG